VKSVGEGVQGLKVGDHAIGSGEFLLRIEKVKAKRISKRAHDKGGILRNILCYNNTRLSVCNSRRRDFDS